MSEMTATRMMNVATTIKSNTMLDLSPTILYALPRHRHPRKSAPRWRKRWPLARRGSGSEPGDAHVHQDPMVRVHGGTDKRANNHTGDNGQDETQGAIGAPRLKS
jgi:hypothetical protein